MAFVGVREDLEFDSVPIQDRVREDRNVAIQYKSLERTPGISACTTWRLLWQSV